MAWRYLREELARINHRLDRIEGLLTVKIKPLTLNLENTALKLDDHHRNSYLEVVRSGEATATEVAKVTGRARAIESTRLNNLVRMGFLQRRHRGREVVFYVENETSNSIHV